ncbi:hypothetical protein DS2_00270 [Catenovulum agarivorans DS-2]|uniref:Uncharacterized protein n=1 Tax=Catenovulum agarivorans DS-2 TaxID=1328313 RepID=W7QJQ6_9ALTE|nr:hypothetical protein [Catenovulum agarivorans]EWH12111.1 hypothetical protein DS2_00270 [Catenovulum agarivorans DS-2]
MKISMIKFSLSALLVATCFGANAQSLDDVTMEITKEQVRTGHRLQIPGRNLVVEHMLDSGALTEAEIETHKAERQADRETLKALKDAGDKDGLAAKLAEIKQKRQANREAIREYINNNDDLKEQLQAKKQEVREKLKERIREKRKERKEKREERREQLQQ